MELFTKILLSLRPFWVLIIGIIQIFILLTVREIFFKNIRYFDTIALMVGLFILLLLVYILSKLEGQRADRLSKNEENERKKRVLINQETMEGEKEL
jgi:uncharacterized membrane protein (DUF373 family)